MKAQLVPLGQALLVWLVAYLIFFHVLVVWKWNYMRPIGFDNELPSTAELTATLSRLDVALQDHDVTRQSIEEQQTLVRTLQARLDSSAANIPKLFGQATTSMSHLGPMPQLSRLLQNLHILKKYRSNGALLQGFFLAIQEIDSLANETVLWRNIPRSVWEPNKIPNVDWDHFVQAECSTVTPQQVDDLVQHLRGVLHIRYDGEHDWPVSLEETHAQLDTYYGDVVTTNVPKVRKAVTKRFDFEELARDTVPKDCAQSHQIWKWMDAGMDAMSRHHDVRQAIVDAAVGKGIVLDAIVPWNEALNVPPLTEASRVTLRQWLDTPLTQQAAVWLDQVVDQVSGYSDRLDSFLDSRVQQDKSFGRAVVQEILRRAGNIQLR